MRRGLLLLASFAALLGCNSLLDFGSYTVKATESSTDGGGGGADADGPSDVKECTKNEECIAKLGDFSICRKQDFKCAKLLSADCPQILGDWKNDNAVILGSILPIVGIDKTGGIPLYNAISVALDDFKTGANGLPPAAGSTTRRPLVVIGCSEESDDVNDADAPVRSAKHLVDDVKVPAIIGASFSGNTQATAQVTIPAGVFLISPTATSVAITDLPDNDLVWRTSPSDVIQAKALTALMPQIEKSTRARLLLGNDVAAKPLRVLILSKGDSYGKGLAAALQGQLNFNGKSALDNLAAGTLVSIDYGDPSSTPPPNYSATRTQVYGSLATAPPSVVFLLGTNEVVPEFLAGLEQQTTWQGGNKPTYLFPDGGLIPELWDLIKSDTALRTRVFGTAPGTNNAIYGLFRSRYSSFIKDGTSPDVGGTAASYDALYLVAYAIGAMSDKPVTGANIALAMKRLVPPGVESLPGSTNINTALAALASGANINYTGASGPLDFDLTKGEASSDIQIWCVPTENKLVDGKAAAGVNSGVFYNAQESSIAGETLEPLSAKVKTTCNYP